MSVTEVNSVMKFKDKDGNITAIYPITKDNVVTTSGDGSAYLATVKGISALTAGASFVMVPHVESTSTSPTIDVNGLGAIRIRRRLTSATTTTYGGYSDAWLSAGKPVKITYDGTFWIADVQKPVASDLSGSVPIANGGTGATSVADAKKNLGIAGSPMNLLDNSDFRNPVNQRGESSYTGSGYTIDQWVNEQGLLTVSVEDGSVRLQRTGSTTDNFKQIVSDIHSILGKTVTYALKADGNVKAVLGYTANGHTSYKGSDESSGVFVGSCTVPENAESVRLFIQPQDANACTLYWAALYEGEYTAEILPEYQPKGYMVEALNCGALNVTATATLLASGWSSSTPYSQTVTVAGMLATDNPHISPVYSDTLATAIDQKEAWEAVSKAVTADGTITFSCFEDKPTTDIPIQVEVNR